MNGGRRVDSQGGRDTDDLPHLRRAIDLARQARTAGEDPFGAVLARDGRTLAE